MQQKYSRQRELLLEELRMRTDHPTADDIYATLRTKIPNISLGTVYRNLSSLSANGQILRIEGEGPDRFDGNTVPHYHMTCVECGRVIDVDIETDPTLDTRAAEATGALIKGHNVMFVGCCQKCLLNLS